MSRKAIEVKVGGENTYFIENKAVCYIEEVQAFILKETGFEIEWLDLSEGDDKVTLPNGERIGWKHCRI